jgi:hypothetical protein
MKYPSFFAAPVACPRKGFPNTRFPGTTLPAFWGLAVLLLSLLVAPVPAQAHNVHATITEVEWNGADRSVEVIVQIHAHQLEARLSLDAGRRLTVLTDADLPEIERAAGALIDRHLAVEADGTLVPLRFLGIEVVDQMVRLYLESDWPEQPKSMRVLNTVFIEDLPGQVNSVVVKVGRSRKAGRIDMKGEPLAFDFP